MENPLDNGRSSERPKRSVEKPDGNPAVLKRTTTGRLEKITGEWRDPGHGDLNGQVMLRRHLQGTGGRGQSGEFAGMYYNCRNKANYI